MSEIQSCSGGDGWSSWSVDRELDGTYFVTVTSNAEHKASGAPKVVYVAEGVVTGRTAMDMAISKSAQYAHRMMS